MSRSTTNESHLQPQPVLPRLSQGRESKAEGRFERVTWDEALDEISEQFRGVIDEYGGEAILPYSYLGTEGILNGLTVGDPFFHACGRRSASGTFLQLGGPHLLLMTLRAGLRPAWTPRALFTPGT